MRHSQLRAFHHVALAGGFSRAAQAMGLSQPSVSDQVKRLEQTYDVLLFQRDTRHVRLTPAGEGLFRLTRELFEVEDRIAAHLDQSRAAITGELRIVADSALHVTEAVSRFRQRHPRAHVSISSGNTEEVLARLRNYEAEIGVVGSAITAPDLDLVDLGHTPIVAVIARDFLPAEITSIAFADLPRQPLIFRELGSRTRAQVEAEARRQGLRLTPVIEAEGREAMREVVASGAGLGFVSRAEFGHDSRLRALPITGADLGMSEALISLAARRDLPMIRAFLRALPGQGD